MNYCMRIVRQLTKISRKRFLKRVISQRSPFNLLILKDFLVGREGFEPSTNGLKARAV